MVRTAAGRLADGMSEAAEVLRALLTHPNPQVPHRAAVKVLELGQKVIDLTELEERLHQLEHLVNRGGSA